MAENSPKSKKRRRIREFPSRLIGRTPWLRRRYARRLVKTMTKYREKRRPLPESLVPIERQLRRVPAHKRAETLEKMLEVGASTSPEEAGRAVRRAAARQQRQSGKGEGVRPGLLPGQRQR